MRRSFLEPSLEIVGAEIFLETFSHVSRISHVIMYHVLSYVCRLYWFLLPMIFLLVPNSFVCRHYIPKWNNMFVGFATWLERFGIGNCFRATLEVLRCHKMFFFWWMMCPLRPRARCWSLCAWCARNNVPEIIFFGNGIYYRRGRDFLEPSLEIVGVDIFFGNFSCVSRISHVIIQNSASTCQPLNCWCITKFVKLSLQFDLCYS